MEDLPNSVLIISTIVFILYFVFCLFLIYELHNDPGFIYEKLGYFWKL